MLHYPSVLHHTCGSANVTEHISKLQVRSVIVLPTCVFVSLNYCVALTCSSARLRDSNIVGFEVSSQEVSGLIKQTEVMYLHVWCHKNCIMFQHKLKLLTQQCKDLQGNK